jgi:DNA-binding transcriptional regulator YiaG
MANPTHSFLASVARRQLPAPAERRRIRESAGVPLREIAGVLKVDTSTVSRWEAGQTMPRGARQVEAYAGLLRRLAEITTP